MSLNTRYTRPVIHPGREQVRVAVASKTASADRQDWLLEVILLSATAVLVTSAFSSIF